MAGRALRVNTTVGGVTYPAGSVPEKGVADLIDNPKVWAEDESPEPVKKPAAKRSSK